MFGKLASDVLGMSDIGQIISPDDYNKTESDDYVMHEDGEKIYFLIKSKTDEYCFTNQSLIHLDGTSAMSKKRTLHRYAYYRCRVSQVYLETAGSMDMDVEIKFQLHEKKFSIDVNKKQLEQLKDLYKALHKIAEVQAGNHYHEEMAHKSLDLALTAMGRVNKADIKMDEELRKLTDYIQGYYSDTRTRYWRHDFSEVFEKYINN